MMNKPMLAGVLVVVLCGCGPRPLPLPRVAPQGVRLPFGLRWNMEKEAVRRALKGYGPGLCEGDFCKWKRETDKFLADYSLGFRNGMLTGFRIIYQVVGPAERALYPARMKKMKRAAQAWEFKDLQSFPLSASGDRYQFVCPGTWMSVDWGEGEFGLSIIIVMQERK
jgi:hypothetical protein